jgi:hypothetical protein
MTDRKAFLKRLAKKHLEENKKVKAIRKKICGAFTKEKDKKECAKEFNKGFIESFVKAAMKK